MNDPNTEIEPASATPPPPPQPPPPPPPPPPLRYSSEIINIEELFEENLTEARKYKVNSPWAATQSICRVPNSLRSVDPTAYTPKIVSLGPYHYGCLLDMNLHKWRALTRALTRANCDSRLYLDAARSLEKRARRFYKAPFSISSDIFVASLVLDAVFVLELFRGVAGEGFESLGYAPNDPVFAIRGVYWLKSDMIMLENQLPLFVLDSILDLQLGREHKLFFYGLVSSLAQRFFSDLVRPTGEHSDAHFGSDAGSSGPLHCLDVFHRSLIRSDSLPINFLLLPSIQSANLRRRQLIHCVTELRNAGIEFRHRKSNQLWGITFKGGVLRIPRLVINHGTKSVFLNLMAFEQCHLERSNYITSYVSFMDNLINSEEDVAYLHKRGIIEHWLGSNKEVADLFNGLCKDVKVDLNECCFSELSKQVNDYYKVKWNNYRALCCDKYFSNPWTIISLIAAVVLLLLTAAQTFYAVYGYQKPNN